MLPVPGVTSRRQDIQQLAKAVAQFYPNLEHIRLPGTAETGNMMMVGEHFYMGLSTRTDVHGAEQLIPILGKYNLTGSMVAMAALFRKQQPTDLG